MGKFQQVEDKFEDWELVSEEIRVVYYRINRQGVNYCLEKQLINARYLIQSELHQLFTILKEKSVSSGKVLQKIQHFFKSLLVIQLRRGKRQQNVCDRFA